jgi:hypothetical protein
MARGTFGTVVNCIDGRTQLPVNKWMQETYNLDYIDTITEPGADKAVVDGAQWQVASVKDRVLISVNAHGSKTVAVVAHHDCVGFPASKSEHIEMTRKAVDLVASWNLGVTVIGLWVGEDWRVEVISAIGAEDE